MGKVAEDQVTEVITFEPSMDIDLTFPTNTLFFTPPSVTMYGTPDEVYIVISIDRGPIACCDVVYYHTAATKTSMLSIVDVFTHWVLNQFEKFMIHSRVDTIFYTTRLLMAQHGQKSFIRDNCVKNDQKPQICIHRYWLNLNNILSWLNTQTATILLYYE